MHIYANLVACESAERLKPKDKPEANHIGESWIGNNVSVWSLWPVWGGDPAALYPG